MKNNFADELDLAVNTLVTRPGSDFQSDDPELQQIMDIAVDLRDLPDPEFRARLKMQLATAGNSEFPVFSRFPRTASSPEPCQDFLPSLFGDSTSSYFLNQRSFAASLLMHAAVLALMVSSGVWAARRVSPIPHVGVKMIFPGDAVLPVGNDRPLHGGGGGGDNDPLRASAGNPPPFSDQQLTPPAAVLRVPDPKLPVKPTVVGPPEIEFPAKELGDPLSRALLASNGPGSVAGIGNGLGRGDGPGKGPGVGIGGDGGIGGSVFQAGHGGVSAPRPVFAPEPEYSDEARKQKYQGNVLLELVVGADGRPRGIRVQRSLGLGLDQKAVDAVARWKFEPATKDGHPVSVLINVEVNFRLF